MEKNNRSDFTWESYYSVSNERKYDLIHRVRRLDPMTGDQTLEEIKGEWESLHTESDDPSLDEKFQAELNRYETRKQRVNDAVNAKRALIDEANELKDSEEFQKTAEKFKDLQKRWRGLGFAGKELNDKLWEEFSSINDYFFERRSEFYQEQGTKREEAKEAKEKLIEQAEAIQNSTDWRSTSNKMRDLMNEWKQAGFASREIENKLWTRFNEARQTFYKAQDEHFAIVREAEKQSRDIKEKLIEETDSLKHSLDFDSVRTRFDEMMTEWKEAGHSGRRHEEKLWNRFREGRDFFYARLTESRNQTREERRQQAFERIDDVNHSIESLEQINEKISAKITQLEARSDQTEETVTELAETRGYLDDNNKKLDSLYEELKRLNDDIDKI